MNWEVVKLRLNMALATLGIVLLGFALALAVADYAFGAQFGVGLMLSILMFIFFLNIIQWLFGPYMINWAYRTIEVTPTDPVYGWLYNTVAEVAKYNGFRDVPKVYIADVPFPNAFAYGSPIAGKRIAFTLPILKLLNRDEIMAVAGHELGHLKHRDVELLMAVGLIPALIYYLGWWIFWGGMFGGGGGNGRGNNGGLLFLIGIAMMAVSFVFQLLVLALNRMREAYADVNSALTVPGGKENLQLALAKLTLSMDPSALEKFKKKSTTNQMASMLFFTNAIEEVPTWDARELVEIWKTTKVPWYAEIFMDHPHPAKRIQLLEKVSKY
ncbi:Protease HtpX-like protein [Saccharolobus shibatae B12]|uniref:Protease HtpX homolog n=1 Tax=Saccharolobus shibatae (strain ATCC 51178 / DSM 5389 / JCM 8931 / NBRC 15437 / B12) TaxID=523848 RepID=A0A8F5BLN2_SACSH|nr:zinc metalloprotease HtpX [Saccharolobus shibatae]QXJ27401.1 Protease HtpX-like protein [Saccharolobus shibatae B12]